MSKTPSDPRDNDPLFAGFLAEWRNIIAVSRSQLGEFHARALARSSVYLARGRA